MKEKNNRGELRLPAKASIRYVVSGVFTKAVGILVTPIFTRLLTGEEYGSYTLYMSWLGALSLAIAVLHSGSVIYRGISRNPKNIDAYMSSVLGVNVVITALFCLLLFAFRVFTELSLLLTAIMSLQLICDTVTGVALTKYRYTYSYKTVMLAGGLTALSSPFIGVLLIRMGFGYIGRIIGLLVASLITSALLVIALLRKSKKIYDSSVWRYTVIGALPLLPHAIATAITAETDKFTISANMGEAALAKYSIAHSIGIAMLFIVNALCSALHPWMIRKLNAREFGVISDTTGRLLTLLVAGILFLVALAPEALAILAPPEYSSAITAILPLALSTIPSFITSIIGVGLSYYEKNTSVGAAALIGCGVNIIACVTLIPAFGYAGAGSAILLSGLANSAVAAFFLKRIGSHTLISARRTVLCLVLALAYGSLLILLYNYASLRILLLIPPAIIAMNTLLGARNMLIEKSA